MTIAVSNNEMVEFGCPYCGFRSGSTPVQGLGAAVWQCGECGKSCIILDGKSGKSGKHPELQPHPRRGIPAHGRPDKRPENGEYFRSRGIGTDNTPGCFVCGGPSGYYSNIAAYVQCKEAGERVVAMFGGKGARLDYREYEPDYVQVKIGACKRHLHCLRNINESTASTTDGIITTQKVEASIRCLCCPECGAFYPGDWRRAETYGNATFECGSHMWLNETERFEQSSECKERKYKNIIRRLLVFADVDVTRGPAIEGWQELMDEATNLVKE